MPFVPVPGVIQVDVIYLIDSQRVENTMYFEKGDGWTLEDISTWLEELNTLIQSDLLPFLSSSLQLIELVARLLDTASSIGLSFVPSPTPSGGVTGDYMPNNVTYTISLKTGLTGRSFRGRNYVPGLPKGDADGNTIQSDLRTGLLAFYNLLITNAAAFGNPMVVVSRYSGVDPVTGKPIPRVTGLSTPVTTAATFDQTLDSQRRRLPGRGR